MRREEGRKRKMDAPSSKVEIKDGECKTCVRVCDSVSMHSFPTVFKTNRVCVSSCRESDWEEYCRSWSSRVVLSVPESDSGHLLF